MTTPTDGHGPAATPQIDDPPEATSEPDDDLADFDFDFDEDIDAQFAEPWDPGKVGTGGDWERSR